MKEKRSCKEVPFFNDRKNITNDELVGQASLPASNREEVQIYRRKLPHWRLHGAIYFVTWRLHTSQPELAAEARAVVFDAIRHFNEDRYVLFAYVVMNDHVHVLVKPRNNYPLYTIMHSWKSFTAHQLQRQFGRQGAVWQEEYFDRIVRDEDELLQKAQYILNNPRKRWPQFGEYPWVGFFCPDE
jgi:REP element-mobilizing transposase RayT